MTGVVGTDALGLRKPTRSSCSLCWVEWPLPGSRATGWLPDTSKSAGEREEGSRSAHLPPGSSDQ